MTEEKIITPKTLVKKPAPKQVRRMTMREGMNIEFYGYRYKVIRVRPRNNTVILKLKGIIS